MTYDSYFAALDEAFWALDGVHEDYTVSQHLAEQDARHEARSIDQRLALASAQSSKAHETARDLALNAQAVASAVPTVRDAVRQDVARRPVTTLGEHRAGTLSAAKKYSQALTVFHQEQQRLAEAAAAEAARLAAEEAERQRLAAEEAERLARLQESKDSLRRDKVTLILGGVLLALFAMGTIGTPNVITLTISVSFWGGIFAAIVAARKGMVFREMAASAAASGAGIAFLAFYGLGMVLAGLSPRIGSVPGAWESFNSGASRFGVLVGLGIVAYVAVRLKAVWPHVKAVRDLTQQEDTQPVTLEKPVDAPGRRVLAERHEAPDANLERLWKS